MRSIQEVGLEILSGTPKPFYVFGGSEYGVKAKYLEKLKDHYQGKVQENPRLLDVTRSFKKKSLFVRDPQLYVVRYDEEFVASLNEVTASSISDCKIVGTIVLLLEDEKMVAKVNKYLPEYTVSVDKVDDQFIFKYLKSDFPELPDSCIQYVMKSHKNYGDCINACRSLSLLSKEDLFPLTYQSVCDLFGRYESSSDANIKKGVLTKNVNLLLKEIDSYEGEISSLFYTLLSSTLDIDKYMSGGYLDADTRKFVKSWKKQDVYNFFNQVYSELKRSRSSNSVDVRNRLEYLVFLLQFDPVPVFHVKEV